MNKNNPKRINDREKVQVRTEEKNGKFKWKKYVTAAVIVLLIEIFLWNHSFWLSMDQEPIVVNEIYTQTGDLFSFEDYFSLESDSYLEIRDINREIKNIYVNIVTDREEQKDTLKICFSMIDEGRRSYYDVSPRMISSRLHKINYISLYPYGDLKSLKISFPGEEYMTIRVKDIVLNPHVPMFFSIERVVLMYLIYLVVVALFFRPYQSYRKPGSGRQRWFTAGLCILSLAAIFPLTMKGNDPSGRSTMNEYTDLTHAMAKGMVALDVNVDERLLAAENPYDNAELSELGILGYMWDYAYYEGQIYVYFGVVPVLLTYLPYYLLTGQDLSHTVVYFAFLFLLIVGAFLLMDSLIKRYCQKLPVKLYYLFLVTFMAGVGTLIFAKRVCIYNLAIMGAVCLTIWGLYLWISSLKETGECVVWKVFLGSVCMALVAGCRPQLLMGSFLAFPIFGEKLKQMLADLKKKKRAGRHGLFLAAFCIPFLGIGLWLMWYNS